MKPHILCAGKTEASHFAAEYLQRSGYPASSDPTPDTKFLLLDIPSIGPGRLTTASQLHTLMQSISENALIFCGRSIDPEFEGYKTMDLLKDEQYLAKNAAITADCALKYAAPLLKTTVPDSRVLIIGWGRIGKCLANLLKSAGCVPTVAARNQNDICLLRAMGYNAIDTKSIPYLPDQYHIIFNTVPAPIMQENIRNRFSAIIVDLASQPGIEGKDVYCARGLPGILAPCSSGKLIAQTVIRYLEENA